jgi:hypothetical protein
MSLPSVKVFRPRLIVEFHTPTAHYRATRLEVDSWEALLREDILQASVSKTLAAPAGTFNVALNGRTGPDGLTWYDRLNPMDLVVIRMQMFDPANPTSTDGKDRVVMIGLIDNVQDTMSVGAGRVIQIQGRDFGKILLEAVQKWFPTDPESILQNEQELIRQKGPSGSPAYLIEWAIRDLLCKTLMKLEFTAYSGTTTAKVGLERLMRYSLASTKELIPFTPGLFSFEGPVWNFMEGIVNRPFNELFVDVRETIAFDSVVAVSGPVEHTSGPTFVFSDANVGVFLRPTPFDTAAWEALKRSGHTIDRAEVMEYALGKNDHEVSSVFSVNPTLKIPMDEDWKNLVPPLKAPEEYRRRYGVKVMEVPIRALETTDETVTKAIQYAQTLQTRLQAWYGENEKHESGTLRVRGNGKYRIGQRVDLPWRKRAYYLEGVSHSFPVLGEFTTSLTLTRGH